MTRPARATSLRFHFETARSSDPAAKLTHRIASARAYWRDGRIVAVYVTWRCGRRSACPPVEVVLPVVDCAGCRDAP